MTDRLSSFAILATMLTVVSLSACNGVPVPPSTLGEEPLLPRSTETGAPCEACAEATQAVALTQEQNSADSQAAAAAEVVRDNAQATLSSANATLSAAQTQNQNNANAIAAQIAGTAEIVRANAQATLSSAGSTQSAALTQDAIRQTQMADLATAGAEAIANQQNKDALAASTQTAVANRIATQTQAAADQARQRDEQRRAPITFLWMWCLPVFIVLLAALVLWGIWRWLRIQQANQRILKNPPGKFQGPTAEVTPHEQADSASPLESRPMDRRPDPTTQDGQMRRRFDEVKRKLQGGDEADEADGPDH